MTCRQRCQWTAESLDFIISIWLLYQAQTNSNWKFSKIILKQTGLLSFKFECWYQESNVDINILNVDINIFNVDIYIGNFDINLVNIDIIIVNIDINIIDCEVNILNVNINIFNVDFNIQMFISTSLMLMSRL